MRGADSFENGYRPAPTAHSLCRKRGDLSRGCNPKLHPASRHLNHPSLRHLYSQLARQGGEGQLVRCHKVAFVSHSYIESACRRKLVYLAQSTELRLMTPSSYPMPHGNYSLDFEFKPGVGLRGYPIHFLHPKRTSTRWSRRQHGCWIRSLRNGLLLVLQKVDETVAAGCHTPSQPTPSLYRA
jgi:hypothetical protein